MSSKRIILRGSVLVNTRVERYRLNYFFNLGEFLATVMKTSNSHYLTHLKEIAYSNKANVSGQKNKIIRLPIISIWVK